ncbi:MAG: chemotaxis protein CheD [Blautia sp.]|jgi:chemotaxis protein CheD
MGETVVGIGGGEVVKDPGKLAAYALGSCVGICLYDERVKVAGMAHILLPSQQAAINKKNPYKFADTAVSQLIGEMERKGASRDRMVAKIAGGAEMFKNASGPQGIGLRNVSAVKEALHKERIPLKAEDTGENYGRTVYFSACNGAMAVKSMGKRMRTL